MSMQMKYFEVERWEQDKISGNLEEYLSECNIILSDVDFKFIFRLFSLDQQP